MRGNGTDSPHNLASKQKRESSDIGAVISGGGDGSTATPVGPNPEGGGRSTPADRGLSPTGGGCKEPPRWLSTPKRTAEAKEGKGAPSRPEVVEPGWGPRGAAADEAAAGKEQGEVE